MFSRACFALVSAALGLALASAPATAAADDGDVVDKGGSLDARRIAADGLVERGALRKLASRPIHVAGRKAVKASKLANQVLAHHRQLRKQLASADAGALYGSYTSKEELIRTKHATVLVSSLSFTVQDP
ncbi:MAG: hypothetical protein KC468_09475, partial [Myxococcales bacterium]|nr:hypothetical protein [Myxococcales bacterium]